jgi:hypothetical protein
MDQKRFMMRILIIGIIAVILITAGVYFVYNKTPSAENNIEYNYFVNNEAGFELMYPKNIELGKELIIVVNRLDSYPSIDAPLGFDQINLSNHQKALMDGNLDTGSIDWGRYQKLVKLPGNTYGEENYIFGRFEVCNIVFEKRLIFFKNNYFVSITLKADPGLITQSVPEYFTEYSAEGCLGWKEGGMDDFNNYLLNDNTKPEVISKWLDDFNTIINSISY